MSARVWSRRRVGFTLVELLVVIAIMGILIALLLPAVQAAREASRRTTCKNNLRNLALGAQAHLSVHKFYPAGGWGWGWAGDPNRGFDGRQPSGWLYNILPFIEEKQIHDLGNGLTGNNLYAQIKIAIETPVTIFFCPSRRAVATVPFVHGTNYVNASPPNRPKVIARNDYVACAGSIGAEEECYGPGTYAEGDRGNHGCWFSANNKKLRGMTVMRGTNGGIITAKMVKDGISKTILYGEKHLHVSLTDTTDHDNDQGWNLGYDRDVIRWCPKNRPPKSDLNNSDYGVFGSRHRDGFHVAMGDASVHALLYDINPQVFENLGDRADGRPVSIP